MKIHSFVKNSSGSLDTWIDLHPPILSDPLDTLEEVFGLGQKTSRDKQIRFLWTAAYQAPLPMGFSRREDWSGVPLPSLFKDILPLKSP